MAADKMALAVTGDTAAAQSALLKLMQNSPATPGQTTNLPAVGLGERMKALRALSPESAGASVQ